MAFWAGAGTISPTNGLTNGTRWTLSKLTLPVNPVPGLPEESSYSGGGIPSAGYAWNQGQNVIQTSFSQGEMWGYVENQAQAGVSLQLQHDLFRRYGLDIVKGSAEDVESASATYTFTGVTVIKTMTVHNGDPVQTIQATIQATVGLVAWKYETATTWAPHVISTNSAAVTISGDGSVQIKQADATDMVKAYLRHRTSSHSFSLIVTPEQYEMPVFENDDLQQALLGILAANIDYTYYWEHAPENSYPATDPHHWTIKIGSTWTVYTIVWDSITLGNLNVKWNNLTNNWIDEDHLFPFEGVPAGIRLT